MAYKIGMISLGCSKNRVDTEQMLAELKQAGYALTLFANQADVLIINTCSFIESAKMESIETILEQVTQRREGAAQKILVTGCLPERYREELARELPEVDGFIGVNQYGDIVSIVQRVLAGERVLDFAMHHPEPQAGRILTTPQHYAYVRIAEGCDLHCTYCAIPSIRGPYRSRPMEEIIQECKQLVKQGVQELILIAQDTSYYGKDLYGQLRLAQLLKCIAQDSGARWIRVLYCYPERITDELLETMASLDSVVPYLDMPLQHVDDTVLRAMGRPTSEAKIRTLLQRIARVGQAHHKPFTLRTTLIAGFPGETQEQHERLVSFVKEGHFDHLGAFAYSQEEGTKAAQMEGQWDEITKEKRAAAVMRAQSATSEIHNRTFVHKKVEVLIEQWDEKAHTAVGRMASQAPEVDGVVLLPDCPRPCLPGTWQTCLIEQAKQYDLIGVLCP